jgi:hypothetical protein
MSAGTNDESERRVPIADDDLPDWDFVADPIALNDSEGAFLAMITEQVLDYERSARTLMTLLISALKHRDRLHIEVHEAVEAVAMMSPADLTICGYEMLCDLLDATSQKRNRR